MSFPIDRKEAKPAYHSSSPGYTGPDRSFVAIVLLAVIALAGTMALLPGSGEKAEALLAEGRYGEAIEMLVSVEDVRPLDAYEGYMLFKLYLLTKQPDNAATLLGQQTALQVDNTWALRQLCDQYRESGDFRGEASVLRQLYEVSPNDKDFDRLRILYRLTADVTSEAILLGQAITAGRTDRAYLDRLSALRSEPETARRAAVWVAPSGRFSSLAPPVPLEILALSDFTAPSITSPE